MAYFAKAAIILLFSAALARATDDCNDDEEIEDIFKKPQKAPERVLEVNYGANVITPIKYITTDYNGPYDPRDPQGALAAFHRRLAVNRQHNLEELKTYIPEGIDKFAKKQLIKLAVGEGKRFAFAHPKETAQLLDIALKTRRFYKTAQKNVENFEEKEEKQQEKEEKQREKEEEKLREKEEKLREREEKRREKEEKRREKEEDDDC